MSFLYFEREVIVVTDEQLREKLSSTRRTTSFGEWTRTPDTRDSKFIDAIRNIRGVSVDAAQKAYPVRIIDTSSDWKNADVGAPRF